MTSAVPAIHPLGEFAWTVSLGDRVNREVHRRVLALTRELLRVPLAGVAELVPGYATVTLFLEPSADPERVRQELAGRLDRPTGPAAEVPAGRLVRIPVRYEGPDLEEVAERTGLTRDEVARRHHSREYQVYLLGFAPGFAYLGELDPALVLPRRSTPRTRVAAGSVAIAAAQTAVYPLATPGGWHLIGHTDLVLFDPARDPPALLRPGDRVRFEPV